MCVAVLSQSEAVKYVAMSLRRSGHGKYVFNDDAVRILFKQTRGRHGNLHAIIDTAVFFATLEEENQVTAEHVERSVSLSDASSNFLHSDKSNSDAFGRWPVSWPRRVGVRNARRSNLATGAIVALTVGLVAMPLDRTEMPPANNEAQTVSSIGNSDSESPKSRDHGQVSGGVPAPDISAMGLHDGTPAEAVSGPSKSAEFSFLRPEVSSLPAVPLSNDQTPATTQASLPAITPLPSAANGPELMPGTSGGSNLLLIAGVGDTIPSLYAKVYRGVRPPPYDTVLAMNETHFRPGKIVVFPAPPGGWSPAGQ